MSGRHGALLAVLLTLPFLGGVQHCNRPAPTTTSGDQQPDTTGATGGTPTGETGGDAGAAGGETAAGTDATGADGEAQPPPETGDQLARRMFDEGLRALTNRPAQYPTAVARFEQVVKLQPEWSAAFYNLGLAYLGQDNVIKAIPVLERATLIDETNGDAWVALGDCYQRQNRTGAALDAYTQCTRHVPGNTDCRLGTVHYAFLQGEDPDSIIRQIKEILAINSTSVGAYLLLSQTYMRQGELKLAQFSLLKAQQANELAQANPTLHCNMGMIYREMGLEFEAEESFKKALEHDPNHLQSLVNLANIKIRNLDFEGAKLLVQRAVLQDEGHIGARLALGIAKRGTGDLQGAQAEFDYVLANDPANTDAMYNLAVLYGDHLRDFDKAIETYEELVRITPGLADDDPVHEYLEEARKGKEREQSRLERDRRKREQEEKRRAEEAAAAAEEAARAAEEARAAAEEAAAAGTPEAGTPEGGTPEGGTPEGGTPEGGTPEGGTPEGGTPDGGAGAGS